MAIDSGGLGEAPVVLVVGNLRDWSRKGIPLPEVDGFHFADYDSVEVDLLDRIEPDIVLSALMADGFDALDLARRLIKTGFGGRYRAVTTNLPLPQSIIDEVRAVAPGLDFDLYVIER